jgi:hypothetical protein
MQISKAKKKKNVREEKELRKGEVYGFRFQGHVQNESNFGYVQFLHSL